MMYGHMSHPAQLHSKKITVPVKGSYVPYRRGPPLGESGHGLIGHVNHVMVDCFSRWTEACPLSDKTSVTLYAVSACQV